jgi:hypothetical protein
MDKRIMSLLEDKYGADRRILESMEQENNENKQWINDLMEMPEGIKSFPLPATMGDKPEFSEIIMLLCSISGDVYSPLDLNFMFKGKNKVRVTRIMGAYWNQIWEKLNNSLLTMNTEATLRDLIDWATDKDEALHKLQCKWGDMTKNGRMGYLSTRMDDFMTLSREGCSFVSCLGIGGDYFSGAIEYLFSPNVMVAFAKETGGTRKIGRCLIFLNENLIISSREYGSWHGAYSLLVRDMVQEKMGGVWVVDGRTGNWVTGTEYGYVDKDYGTATKRRDSVPTVITIPYGTCMVCGGELDQATGQCSDCGGDECIHCGCRGSELESFDGELYCDNCLSSLTFVCEYCDDRFWNEPVSDADGNIYCQDCYDQRFRACDVCGDEVRLKHAYEHDNRIFCYDCYHEEFTSCSRCGEVMSQHEDDIMEVDGDNYCLRCYDNLFLTCENCDESAKSEDCTRVDGRWYCPDCYDKLFVECKSCNGVIKHEDAAQVNGCLYCSDCCNDLFVKCQRCGDYVDRDDAAEVEGCWYCDDCCSGLFMECEKCGKLSPEKDIIEVNGSWHCPACVFGTPVNHKIMQITEGMSDGQFA